MNYAAIKTVILQTDRVYGSVCSFPAAHTTARAALMRWLGIFNMENPLHRKQLIGCLKCWHLTM